MGVSDRIRGCIAIERAASDIYKLLASRFPADSELWEQLALEEKEHERIFMLVDDYGPFDDDPSDGPALPKEDIIIRTMEYLGALYKRLGFTGLSRKEAFGIALKLEEGMVENYLNELKELERLGRHLEILGTVLESERTHLDIITLYMQKQGVARFS